MIIAAVGQKGGVGKTTLTLNVACELHERGHKVLLVDTDPQGTLRTWADVAEDHGHVIPTLIVMGPTLYRPHELPRIADNYDFVFIDTKGEKANKVQKAALMASDVALMPLSNSPADLWGMTDTVSTVEDAQMVRPHLRAFFVYSDWQPRTNIARQVTRAVESSDFDVIAPPIPGSVDFKESMGVGLGVTQYAPKGKAARSIRVFANKLEALKEQRKEVV